MTTNEGTRFGLLHQRDFRLLWIGESVSSLGSSVTGVALPLVAVTVLDAAVRGRRVGGGRLAALAAYLSACRRVSGWTASRAAA